MAKIPECLCLLCDISLASLCAVHWPQNRLVVLCFSYVSGCLWVLFVSASEHTADEGRCSRSPLLVQEMYPHPTSMCCSLNTQMPSSPSKAIRLHIQGVLKATGCIQPLSLI